MRCSPAPIADERSPPLRIQPRSAALRHDGSLLHVCRRRCHRRRMEVKLLDRVREAIRTRHYSPRTEEAYVSWIRRFIVFHGRRHPLDLGAPEVSAFVSSLAARGVSASTQNQALSAVLFLYEAALGRRLPWMEAIVRAQRPLRLPVVLSRGEVSALLSRLHGPVWLMASLLYGGGLRLLECVELRVKDVQFESVLQRAVKGAARAAGISRPATCHSLRRLREIEVAGVLRQTPAAVGISVYPELSTICYAD